MPLCAHIEIGDRLAHLGKARDLKSDAVRAIPAGKLGDDQPVRSDHHRLVYAQPKVGVERIKGAMDGDRVTVRDRRKAANARAEQIGRQCGGVLKGDI